MKIVLHRMSLHLMSNKIGGSSKHQLIVKSQRNEKRRIV